MTTTKKQKSDTTAPRATKKRIRLTPEIRKQQILDAALIEFSSLGFTAASISKIASRVGTSKANLYVHFANKDEIFETLVREVLVPSPKQLAVASARSEPGRCDRCIHRRKIW